MNWEKTAKSSLIMRALSQGVHFTVHDTISLPMPNTAGTLTLVVCHHGVSSGPKSLLNFHGFARVCLPIWSWRLE